MKSKLNITLDDKLLNNAKRYASRHKISLSQLIEQYIKSLTRSPRRKNVIQIVEGLKKPSIDPKANLKELYYEDQKKKHGL